MQTRARWIFALSLACVSCKPPQTNVPTQYQGTDIVTFENYLATDICEIRLTRKGDSPSKNWLGRNLAPGAKAQVKVKPGLYVLSVGCYQQFHAMDNVIVSGTTKLGFGKRPPIVRGEASLLIPVTMNAATGPAPSGGGGGGGDGDERQCTGMCGGQFGNCCPDEGWYCVIDPKDRREMGDGATGVCTLK